MEIQLANCDNFFFFQITHCILKCPHILTVVELCVRAQCQNESFGHCLCIWCELVDNVLLICECDMNEMTIAILLSLQCMLRHFDVIVHFGLSFLKFAGLSISFGENGTAWYMVLHGKNWLVFGFVDNSIFLVCVYMW